MDKLKSLYLDSHQKGLVRVDDFLVSVGKTKSNSVYHVAEVNERPSPRRFAVSRYHMKVYVSDLITACKRDKNTQRLIPFGWYKREKKGKPKT